MSDEKAANCGAGKPPPAARTQRGSAWASRLPHGCGLEQVYPLLLGHPSMPGSLVGRATSMPPAPNRLSGKRVGSGLANCHNDHSPSFRDLTQWRLISHFCGGHLGEGGSVLQSLRAPGLCGQTGEDHRGGGRLNVGCLDSASLPSAKAWSQGCA